MPSIVRSDKLIAHAMGGIDGVSYTNSLEAFHENYKKGYRTFEVDLIFTSDNQLVACHDWDSINNGVPMTYNQFINTKINDKYTPLNINDIIHLIEKYKDIHIITDTKVTDKTSTTNAFQAIINSANKIDRLTLSRIIPQIYNQEMYGWVTDIYNFNDFIYTLYQSDDTDDEIATFAAKNNITKITMSESRFNETLVRELTKIKTITYVHTINSISTLKYYKNKGVFGFYTDEINPKTKSRMPQPSLAKLFSSV